MRIALLVMLALLTACVGGGHRLGVPEGSAHWRLQGRLAVSDGRDGGSGSVTWIQDGRYYDITLRAPVSGQSWRLSGDDALCTLEGLREAPIVAQSPEALLHRELGWHLPVAALRDWLRGRPMAADTPVERDADGHVVRFSEAGWAIVYSAYRDGLPTRIVARQGKQQVRLAIQSWVALP